jgi:pyruvate carboxylase
MGAHMLAIKDMAGLCKPYAAGVLVKALREAVALPIHFHTHDTSGVSAASVLRAADAGVDIADAALSSMSGMTSQPNLNSLVAALRHTSRDSGLDQAALDDLSDYWAAVRELYYPFEEGLKAPASDVYRHEMPGGQFTNLRQQAKSMGLEGRWREVADAYAAANQVLGDIVKVTPSSKVVGDLALFMVTNHLSADDLLNAPGHASYPRSVVEMMQGMLGEPEGGWPEKFQRTVLASAHAEPIEGRPGATLPKVNLKAVAKELSAKIKRPVTDEMVMSYVLYPEVFLEFAEHRRLYSDTSVIPTRNFFFGVQPGEEIAVEIEEGKTLIISLLTVGAAREDGTCTVFFELNGQPREVRIQDRTVDAVRARHPKADPDDANHVAAPMPGKISSIAAKPGSQVKAGDRLLSIEAMKMETAVYAQREAKIAKVLVTAGSVVESGDLLVLLEG